MIKKIVLCLVLMLVTSVFLFAQGTLKYIAQEVLDVGGYYPDNVIYPEEGTVEFKCWITARPEYIMYGPDPIISAFAWMQGGRFLVIIQVANFLSDKVQSPKDWEPGEIIRFEITHTPTGNIAIAEFPLTPRSDAMFRFGRDGFETVLKPPAGRLFSSESPIFDEITTTAQLVEDYPNEDGVYRAVDWEKDDNWMISFPTKKVVSDLLVKSQLRREYDEEEGEVAGPQRFRTYYSIDDGENWTQHPEENFMLPVDSEDWMSIDFELPEECYNLDSVKVKWELYSTAQYWDGWGEIRNVVVTGEQEEIIPPVGGINPSPADKEKGVSLNPTFSWTYESTEGHHDPEGYTFRVSAKEDFSSSTFFKVEGGPGTYTITDVDFEFEYETTYYWHAEPYNEGGIASPCPVWTFETEILLPSPYDLVYTIEPSTIFLEWEEPETPEEVSRSSLISPESLIQSKTRPAGDLLGYNVYRNDEKINSGLVGNAYYLDSGLESGVTYTYYVTAVYENGESPASNVVEVDFVGIADEMLIPAVTKLSNNYPNPFNPSTVISFGLAESGIVAIDIFNSRGQKVKTLINDHLNAGYHKVEWNGKDAANKSVSSGIYFYRMQNGSYTASKKMILMK